eukprot:TRINITY_DN4945_c3_g1_i2.p1 TRINITY_DN4945_c3_g1~~TRINITY_DN4945_c3_g1_i2.p1  ORF type:complete len:641 (+),score=226.91 TRINITY_DN4945_c3_g1_i2:68-1924(+)
MGPGLVPLPRSAAQPAHPQKEVTWQIYRAGGLPSPPEKDRAAFTRRLRNATGGAQAGTPLPAVRRGPRPAAITVPADGGPGALLATQSSPRADLGSPTSQPSGLSGWDPATAGAGGCPVSPRSPSGPAALSVMARTAVTTARERGAAGGSEGDAHAAGQRQRRLRETQTLVGRAGAALLHQKMRAQLQQLEQRHPPGEREHAPGRVEYMLQARKMHGGIVSELTRQVATSCAEWGAVLFTVWEHFASLFDTLAEMFMSEQSSSSAARARADEELQCMRYNYLVAVQRLEQAVRERSADHAEMRRREQEAAEQHAAELQAAVERVTADLRAEREAERAVELGARQRAEEELARLRAEMEATESGARCKELSAALAVLEEGSLRMRLQLMDAQCALQAAGRKEAAMDYSRLTGASLRQALADRMPPPVELMPETTQTSADDLSGTQRDAYLDGVLEWTRQVCGGDLDAPDDGAQAPTATSAPQDESSPKGDAKRRARRGSGLPGKKPAGKGKRPGGVANPSGEQLLGSDKKGQAPAKRSGGVSAAPPKQQAARTPQAAHDSDSDTERQPEAGSPRSGRMSRARGASMANSPGGSARRERSSPAGGHGEGELDASVVRPEA